MGGTCLWISWAGPLLEASSQPIGPLLLTVKREDTPEVYAVYLQFGSLLLYYWNRTHIAFVHFGVSCTTVCLYFNHSYVHMDSLGIFPVSILRVSLHSRLASAQTHRGRDERALGNRSYSFECSYVYSMVGVARQGQPYPGLSNRPLVISTAY